MRTETRPTKMLAPKPLSGVIIADPRECVVGTDLCAMAPDRRELSRRPVPHIDGKG
jgi:hypothetical protein